MKTKTESVRKSKSKSNESNNQHGESVTMEPTASQDDCPREQMIAEAAYYYAERRGFSPDNHLTDWLQAEVDIAARLAGGR